MRIVLDTNILVRANPKTSPEGLAHDLLLMIAKGPHMLILSPAILAEVQRVLTYPHVQARWPLTQEAIEQYLSFLEAASELVDVTASCAVVIEDPDDDPILQTAVSGRAGVLCTRDDAFRHPRVEEVCRSQGVSRPGRCDPDPGASPQRQGRRQRGSMSRGDAAAALGPRCFSSAAPSIPSPTLTHRF